MHQLDSDTLTYLHAGQQKVVQRLADCGIRKWGSRSSPRSKPCAARFDHLVKANDPADFLRTQRLLLRTQELLSRLLIIPLDEVALEQFERLRKMKGLKKHEHADLLIAGISLAHQAVLVTRNVRHFEGVP